ncbi:MmyB family transcriptional regulator [Microbispora rosea]|uniref:MmyB family transcriptional regulator n=1 Tax=Microbispora rosea TaxID=58117 RepID=UPI00343E556B
MENLLGEFLRARRQATTVERAGVLRGAGSRRTPGLRREEIATLAGVGVDYYTRLEQGRERSPSDAVLNALAGVFGLDYEATEHLHELARSARGSFRHTHVADHACSSVLRLVNNWEHALAFVVNRRLDVLVQNAETEAFFEGLSHSDNLLRLTFLDPASREFFLDWEQEATVQGRPHARCRGADLDDPSVASDSLSHMPSPAPHPTTPWPGCLPAGAPIGTHEPRGRARQCLSDGPVSVLSRVLIDPKRQEPPR